MSQKLGGSVPDRPHSALNEALQNFCQGRKKKPGSRIRGEIFPPAPPARWKLFELNFGAPGAGVQLWGPGERVRAARAGAARAGPRCWAAGGSGPRRRAAERFRCSGRPGCAASSGSTRARYCTQRPIAGTELSAPAPKARGSSRRPLPERHNHANKTSTCSLTCP